MRGSGTSAGTWLELTPSGLYCAAGDFYLDPTAPVERALITHGHADHAVSGHGAVLATQTTLEVLRVRYGSQAFHTAQVARYGETLRFGGVAVTLHPAGHVLGSAQVLLSAFGWRVIFTGDFKRTPDPSCAPFEPLPADLLITEATFGLPIFNHPPPEREISRLLQSMTLFPERAHLVGVYALGKCQRTIALLRQAGFDRPIYVHGALLAICAMYQREGIELGELRSATEANKEELRGALVLCPPGALADRWSRRFPDPVRSLASGLMAVRARARQQRIELPLVLSDHADWGELLRTVEETGASEVWVTHGHEEALVHVLRGRGLNARGLGLSGYEEEAE